MNTPTTIATHLAQGERAALARALSWVEDGAAEADALLDALTWRPRALRLGVTGPPGAGKSSLIARLVQVYRARGHSVGILAFDPSSQMSGGALLGDRVRLGALAGDPGVFIRSMASRGGSGGLARAAGIAVECLDAAGFDRILVETVGAGQTDQEVADWVHAVLVVLVPEAGDQVQSMKAGLLELADILVVNKSDRAGSGALVQALEDAVGLRASGFRRPPVLTTCATTGDGVEALVDCCERAAAAASEDYQLGRRRALKRELERRLGALLWSRVAAGWDAPLGDLAASLAAGASWGDAQRSLERMVGELWTESPK